MDYTEFLNPSSYSRLLSTFLKHPASSFFWLKFKNVFSRTTLVLLGISVHLNDDLNAMNSTERTRSVSSNRSIENMACSTVAYW